MIKWCFIVFISFLGEKVSAQFDSIPFDGYQRTFLVHAPPTYNGVDALPLIIAMHGGFGSAANLQNQSLLSEKSDTENFIVVYPEGVQSILNIRTWNAGACCGFASNSNVDDVGFISALIDTLLLDFAIDESRIYATGMSNGGFMAHRLACELSHRIAAIAPVACSMALESCDPERPVPIIQFHSYQDLNIPYLGGEGDGPSVHYNPPQDSVMNVWAEKDECVVLNEVVEDNDQYTFTRWSDCECLAEIHHYISTDGGHSWPGGTATFLGDPVSDFINANDLMWDFFEFYSLECNTTRVDDVERGNEVLLFPNPSTGMFQYDLENFEGEVKIEIFDGSGRCVAFEHRAGLLNLGQLPPGFYVIKFRDSNKELVSKVVLAD